MGKTVTYVETYTEGCDENDWRAYVIIEDEGGRGLFGIGQGEPEDMTLDRDLSDALSVSDLILNANKLGLEGTEIKFKFKEGEAQWD
jgi:hypothetical protein